MSVNTHATISVPMPLIIRPMLFVLILLTGCRSQRSPVVFIDPALAVLVPPDAVAIGGVRMGQLAETPAFDRWVKQGRIQTFEQFRRRTGLDLSRDIWEVVAATDGKEAVVLLRGRFTQQGREPQLQIEGARRWAYKGYTLIGNEQAAVLFLNPTTAVAGPVPAVQRVVDRRDTNAGIPPALEARIKKIPSTNQVWFAAALAGRLSDLTSGSAGMWSNLARLASSVQFASGGLDLTRTVRSNIAVESATEKDAEDLRGALRALLGLGRLNTPEDRREMLSVFDGMQVSREGSLVRFTTDIPFDLLEKSAAPFLTPRAK